MYSKKTNKDFGRATTAQLYPGRDTFEFDQGHVAKNQPITVLILLSESLAITTIIGVVGLFTTIFAAKLIILFFNLLCQNAIDIQNPLLHK